LRGEELEEEREIRIDLPVRAYVPVGWIAHEALRLDLYRRIATALDHERLSEVREEAIDRYGKLPPRSRRSSTWRRSGSRASASASRRSPPTATRCGSARSAFLQSARPSCRGGFRAPPTTGPRRL